MPDRRPWDRLPEESEPAYAAFCLYMEHGSLEAVHQHRKKQPGSRSKAEVIPGGLLKWSTENAWVERRDAHRDHLRDIERRSAEVEVARRGRNWGKELAEIDEELLAIERQGIAKLRELLEMPLRRVSQNMVETYEDGREKRVEVTIEPIKWTLSGASSLAAVLSSVADRIGKRRDPRVFADDDPEDIPDVVDVDALLLKARGE